MNVSRETMEEIDFKIIAIDGPSGVGKSTISSQIADRLGFYYVDTGAMFRCLAWNWGRHGSPENEDSLLKLGNQTEILLSQKAVICNGTDVTHIIREEKISIKIGARYKLKDAVQAHKDLENRKTTGCVLLVP